MKTVFKGIWMRIISILISFFALFNVTLPCLTPEPSEYNTQYANVLVHGLMGWGSYDFYYDAFPYWGMLGGDAVEQLEMKGFECYCPSLAPSGSAWDRACELYAQLTGTRVDYGEAHSKTYAHERYGKDYTKNPLLDFEWNEENKINLYGHSLGGVTVRLLAELMYNGSAQEREATTDGTLSGLFTGGKDSWIYSLTTLSAPHNGTSAYESEKWAADDESLVAAIERTYNEVDPSGVLFDIFVKMNSDLDNGLLPDTAHYDMRIDNAMALNEHISTLPEVYYFSFSTCATHEDENGFQVPTAGEIEPLFYTRSIGIGKNTFVTEGGYEVDEKWLPNDGLVNTYSALAPLGAPRTDFDENHIEPGIWNVMPVFEGDHTAFAGDLLHVRDIVPFFTELFTMINML